ncbi:MAG: hypothetical protein ABXS92_05805 [Sulfurimonas sp.]
MKTPLTEEQQECIAQKDAFVTKKAELLKEYKSYESDLEFAEDEFEEGLIAAKREKLAKEIKDLGSKIREIESLESQA